MKTNNGPVLEIRDLSVAFNIEGSLVPVVRNVDLTLFPGRTLCLVGESGSGKSVTARAIMGLERASGEVRFNGLNLLNADEETWRSIRGNRIAIIFQDAMTALHPVIPVQVQMMEALKAHGFKDRLKARDRCVEMLRRVNIPNPEECMRKYTFELSGGQRQRVMIAMSLLRNPSIIIADEPTTALDVVIQAQVLDLFKELQKDPEIKTAILFITHDMGVVADLADDIAVMYGGQIMEQGPVDAVFQNPRHPYTRGLLNSVPILGEPGRIIAPIHGLPPEAQKLDKGCPFRSRCQLCEEHCAEPVSMKWTELNHGVRCVYTGATKKGTMSGVREKEVRSKVGVMVSVKKLCVRFPVDSGLFRGPTKWVHAVDGVDIDIPCGATVALVGESGCGKSTLGRAILRINDRAYEEGHIYFGESKSDLCLYPQSKLRPFRRLMQMIFQDPASSLNSRMTIFDCIAEPLRVHRVCRSKDELNRCVEKLMEQVGLQPGLKKHYPHEFSGGMQQRVGIARALALQPKLIVCDEPTSSLDVSIQEQIIQLLMQLRNELGLTYLFISHNIAAVERIADSVAVMYLGKIVEFDVTGQVIGRPRHPYTKALISAVPVANPIKQRDRKREHLGGDVPSPVNRPTGCAFHPRCPVLQARCKQEAPLLRQIGDGRKVACHLLE